jgi:hypothetical protein
MSGNETFYDEIVVPALAALAKQCEERGMPFLCMVGYSHGDFGTTITHPSNPGLAYIIAKFGMLCKGNVDSLMIGIKRYCAENNIDTSASMFLRTHSAAFLRGMADAAEQEEKRKAAEGKAP